MKPFAITIVAGCFLLAAVALHDYVTPVFSAGGDQNQMYVQQYGRLYQVMPGAKRFYTDSRGMHWKYGNETETNP